MDNAYTNTSKNRFSGIDLFRLIAAGGVVCIHVSALQASDGGSEFDQWLAALNRFAVPYFFVVSGFLAGVRRNRGSLEIIRALIKRILPVWAFWELVYVGLYAASRYSNGLPLFGDLRFFNLLIGGGYGFHLWFLPSLLFVSITTVFLDKMFSWAYILFAAVICYALLIILRYGAIIPFKDGNHATLDTAVRSLEGIFFYVFGYWICISKFIMSWKNSIILLSIGVVAHLSETAFLHEFFGMNIKDIEVTSSLPLLVFGLLFVSLKTMICPQRRRLVALSQYSLGIYAVHLIFARVVVDRITIPDQAVEILVQAAMAICLSVALVYVLSLWRIFRIFIK